MAKVEVAQVKLRSHLDDFEEIVVYPPQDLDVFRGLHTEYRNRILITNDESDCTEISFDPHDGEPPLSHDELNSRVVSELESQGHQVSIIRPMVSLSMLDGLPVPGSVYASVIDQAARQPVRS